MLPHLVLPTCDAAGLMLALVQVLVLVLALKLLTLLPILLEVPLCPPRRFSRP